MDKQELDDELATIDISTNEMAPYICSEYFCAFIIKLNVYHSLSGPV